MNKLFTKIAGLGLGLALAIGVGAAIGSESGAASRTEALGTLLGTYTITGENTVSGATGSVGTPSWSGPSKTTALSNSKTFSVSGLSDYIITDAVVGIRRSTNSKSKATFSWKFDSQTATGVAFSYDDLSNSFEDKTLFTGLSKTGSTFSFTTSNTGSSVYLESVKLYGSPASTDPEVTLTKTGSTTIMLNKDGSATSVTGLTASSSHITNPVYKWEIVNPSKEDMASISGTGTTPTMSVSKDGTLEVKVSARASADPDESASYTACTSNVSLTINPYGGSIAWTNASSLTFKEDVGFDFSTTGIATTMNDGSTVNYGGDYSSIHLYVGSNEVDDNDVDADYCATSREYKLYDSVRDVWSSTVSTTLTYSAKATITALTSVAGITEISTSQSIYLRTTVSSGYGDTVTYSTESSLITVDSSTGLITSKTTAGDNIVVTATLASGDSANFTMKVSASRTYTVQEAYDMVTGFGGGNNSYYGSNSQYYLVEGIYYKENSSYYLVDDASNPTIRLRMYSYDSWTVASGVPAKNTFVNGGKLTVNVKLNKYSSTNCSVDLEYGSQSGNIKAYKGPVAESFEITGASEVLMGESLQLSITNVSPSGASTDVTWETSDDTYSIVVDGEFIASKSGVYTVTATSTDEKEGGGYASDTHEIHVYEYQETVLALKDSPKTSYFKDEYVEDGLVTATIKYKCGETLNYKSEVVDAANVAPSYTYGGAALTDSQFKTVNATGATLAVTSVLIQSSIIEDPFEITSGLSGLTVSDVKVFAIEIDLENCVIAPTYDTTQYTMPTFGFGGTFTHAGSITVAYKNGYSGRNVNLADATVEEYNMKKLGVQTVKVYVDDSAYSGVAKAYVGSYDIKVTNVGAAGNAGGSADENLETSTTGSNMSANYEFKKDLDSAVSNVTSVTLSFEGYVTNNATHGFTFKLYNSSGTVVATSSEVSKSATGSKSNIWTAEFTFNTPVEIASASYTLTTRGSGSNVRQRSFDITTVSTVENFDRDQAIAYAKYFNSEVGELCDVDGNTSAANVTAISNKWSTLKTEYEAMIKAAKDYFAAHTDQTDIARTLGMYRKIILRYKTSADDNFIKDGSNNAVVSAIRLPDIVLTTNSTAVIIIVASIVSLTAIGGYFLFKKKRQ